MDLEKLESKLKEMKDKHSIPFSPTSQQNVNNEYFSTNNQTPVNITRKINEISNEDVEIYSDRVIPNWKIFKLYMKVSGTKKKKNFKRI